MRAKKFLKRAGLGTLAGIIGLHLATQTRHGIEEAYNSMYPSPQRVAFEERFDVPIHGSRSNLEGNDKYFFMIADVLARERAIGDIPLDEITIRDSNYLNLGLLDQWRRLIFRPISGKYCDDRITLLDNVSHQTVHHELAHARMFDILEDHPELLKRWSAIAVDENGETQYMDPRSRFMRRFRVLASFVSEEPRAEHDGFVSNYARTNILEDIAELCAEAAMSPQFVTGQILSDNPDERLARKVALAQEYGLIPPEFMEFAGLERYYQSCFLGASMLFDQNKSLQYLEFSREFLSLNPDSVYASEVLVNRALFMYNRALSRHLPCTVADAINEYYAALDTAYASPMMCLVVLDRLHDIFAYHDPEHADAFRLAYDEYARRMEAGDVTLTGQSTMGILRDYGVDISRERN